MYMPRRVDIAETGAVYRTASVYIKAGYQHVQWLLGPGETNIRISELDLFGDSGLAFTLDMRLM